MISVKALEAAFPGKGATLRQILTGSMSYVDGYKSVSKWIGECYHMPTPGDRRMLAANEVLEGYGIEAIQGESLTKPAATYVNMGDTYAATILYNHHTGTWQLTSWGDFVERNERRYRLQ